MARALETLTGALFQRPPLISAGEGAAGRLAGRQAGSSAARQSGMEAARTSGRQPRRHARWQPGGQAGRKQLVGCTNAGLAANELALSWVAEKSPYGCSWVWPQPI